MPDQNQIRSKILHKGLALIIVPCLIDGIFCWQLLEVLDRKEKLEQADRRQNLILQTSISVLTNYGATTTALGNSMFAASPASRTIQTDVARKGIKLMRADFLKLEQQTADDPEMHRQIMKMHQSTQDQLTQFEAITNDETATDTSFVSIVNKVKNHKIPAMFSKAAINSGIVIKLIKQQQASLDELRVIEAAQQQHLKNLIFYGIVGNFLLALAFGLWFLKSITSRLSVVVDNAQKLPKGTELNTRIRGNDELAYLDRTLHDAAKELRAASEHRQYLMQMVAHDLRSPLMSAQVALNILGDDRLGELPALAKRQIDSLKRNIFRLTNLTNDLLTIDKLEAGKLDISLLDLSVEEVVNESIQSLSDLAAQKSIQLVNQCHEQYFKADKGRVLQVLTNLVSNAIKFAPESTPVVISCTTDNDLAKISVCDQGPGVPEGDQQKIFSKFYQLDNGTGKGFGLGLAICKLIIEAQSGTINVTSEPGKGSTFWFTLPAGNAQDAVLSQHQLRTVQPSAKETT